MQNWTSVDVLRFTNKNHLKEINFASFGRVRTAISALSFE